MPKNRTYIIVSSLLFLIIVCSYIVMALKFPVAYIIATYEDSFGEWAQVFFFIAVFTFSLRLAFVKSKFRVFFILLTLASFYTFMEEISWGQRILNITPPEFFMEHNLQRETNLHNFITGPYSTLIKSVIEYILFTGLIFWGLIYPFALTKRVPFAQWIESRGLPSPPLYLWPYFVASALLELRIFRFNEAEIAEILIPLGLCIFLLHYMIAPHTESISDNYNQTSLDIHKSKKLAISICAIFFYAIILSTGATYASYSSPRLKSKMDAKFVNGIEKFAGRYKHYEMWETAIRLYSKIDAKEPERPSIQRNLAYCYNKTGNTERETYYIDNAFKLDRKKLDVMPTSISAHLSIADTYNQINNFKKENYYLDKALDIALDRVKRNPKSASAAYWLGRTYEQHGNKRGAFKHFKHAFILKPHMKKYRKAYMNSQRLNYDISEEEK